MSLPSLSKGVKEESISIHQAAGHDRPAESSLIPGVKPDSPLDITRGAIRAPSPNPSLLSIGDADSILRSHSPGLIPAQQGYGHASRSPQVPRTLKSRVKIFWTTNKGLALVVIAQLFGTLMNVTTRMLEMEGNNGMLHSKPHSQDVVTFISDASIGKGYHPFQILFARMFITVVCASLYMWYTATEHFPWGLREVRPLLIARGLTGFFGVFGMYCESTTYRRAVPHEHNSILSAALSADGSYNRNICAALLLQMGSIPCPINHHLSFPVVRIALLTLQQIHCCICHSPTPPS